MIPGEATGWTRWRPAALLLVAAALFLPPVWTRDLWDPDEPKYAEATRQMDLRGDLLVPHFNGEVYSEKPPLFFWLSLAAGRLPGVPPGAGGRLVGALAAAGTLILTWRIGALVAGEATGALAAWLLSGCLLFWHLGQSGVIDPLLAFCCAGAIWGFARHLGGLKAGLLIFYVACAAGVLAKGPVGLLVPALAALSFRLLSVGPRRLLAAHPLWGVPLAAAPALLWLALAAGRAGRGYLETMLITQNLGRAVDAYVHARPFYYYLIVLPAVLMPLTLFLPQSMAAAWREKVRGIRPMLLPLAWLVSSLLFFSLISGKKTRYMLVLAPAAALLVAGWFTRRFLSPEGRIHRGRIPLSAAAAAGVLAGCALALLAITGTAAIPARLLEPLSQPHNREALAALESVLAWPGALRILAPAAILAGACGLALKLALARRGEALTALLAGWLLFLAVAGVVCVPLLDPVKSARGLAELVRERAQEAPLYLIDDNTVPGLNFYLGEDRIPVLRNRAERMGATRVPGARFIGHQLDMDRLERRAGIRFGPRVCRRVGSDVICLASALPPEDAALSAPGATRRDPAR